MATPNTAGVAALIISQFGDFVGYSSFGNLDPAFVGHSSSNAPLATNQLSFPVVLYSPSLNSHRRENVYEVPASWITPPVDMAGWPRAAPLIVSRAMTASACREIVHMGAAPPVSRECAPALATNAP